MRNKSSPREYMRWKLDPTGDFGAYAGEPTRSAGARTAEIGRNRERPKLTLTEDRDGNTVRDRLVLVTTGAADAPVRRRGRSSRASIRDRRRSSPPRMRRRKVRSQL